MKRLTHAGVDFSCRQDDLLHISTNHATIAVRIVGDGKKPVLLIHGLGLTHRTWMPAARILAGHGMTAVALDLSTHGQSVHKGTVAGIDCHADDVIGIADYFGFEQFIIVGHSYGGRIAQRVTEKNRSRISAMGLVSTWHGPLPDPIQKRVRLFFKIVMAIAPKMRAVPSRLMPEYMFEFIHSPNLSSFQDFNACVGERAASVPVQKPRVAVLHASHDYTIPCELGKKAAEIWGGSFREIKGFLHHVPYARPELTANWILESLVS
jgi:pimeloyl-ACP methyl ester carboxylesterase